MANDYHLIPSNEAGDTTPGNEAGFVDPTALTNNGKGFLEAFEGDSLKAYPDGNGAATVGVGFLLKGKPISEKDYLAELNIRFGSANYSAIVKALDGSYRTTKVNGITTTGYAKLQAALTTANGGSPLPSLTDAEVKDLWKEIVLTKSSSGEYETFNRLISKSKYQIDSANLLNSTEGVALFSLSYNGLLAKSPTLLSDLNQYSFNRPDAWFQIRYGSNPSYSGGVAARRYAESQLFGLYASTDQSAADVTNVEALSIYAEFSKQKAGDPSATNRAVAFSYEYSLSREIGLANETISGSQSPIPQDAPAVAGLQVQTLENALGWAAQELISNYITNASLNPWVGDFANTTIDPLDVQVAGSQLFLGTDLQASHRNGYDLFQSIDPSRSLEYQNSLLIAQAGNDTLDGTGTGNDALIGGTGDDTIIGGTGNDYIVAGTGNDSISLTGGNDTVVLGEASNPGAGGQDTVYASDDTGSVTYYVGQHAHDTLYLSNLGSTQINIVSQLGVSKALTITAQSMGNGTWFDPTTKDWITKSGATLTVHYDIVDAAPATGASTSSGGFLQSLADALIPTASASDLSSSSLEQLNAAAAQGAGVLTLYNFTGSSGDGITLDTAPTPVTPTLAASNLSALDRYAPGDTSIVFDNFYGDDGKHGTQLLDSIYGSNTNGGIASYIDGFGNASFIYAGDGDNTVVGDNGNFDTVTQGYDNGPNPNLYVLAGTGNQLIFGNSSGKETLQGGSAGALGEFETIFGSGADASISLGTEDGYVFGGTGADTLDAGSAQSYNVAGIDTVDAALIASVTYDQNSDTISTESVSGGTPDTYQIYLNGSALLGSSLDPGVAGATTLPGSLLIGGTGNDALVGNVGNDTLIGGTESVITPSTGGASVTIHDVLIGGAGSDLLIAGDGNDVLYADMNPVVSNWADLDPTQSDTIYGGAGYDLVYGSGGSDFFYGGSGSFNVQVGNGASYVFAGSGATTVKGGSGGDYIEGGSGVDLLVGGTGNDTIFGGSGASSLYGWGGNDYINGGGGDDYLMANAGPADNSDWADAGSADSVTIDGGGGNDTIFGSGGSNLIFAGSGNDAIELGDGSSTVDAGSGSDTFYAGTGDETFEVADNGEQDAIVNPTSASSITLNMQGLSADGVSFFNDGSGDLVVGFGGSSVTLVGYISSGESNVSLTFADGSSLGAGNIAKALSEPDGTVAWGSNGATDTITANDGNDSIGNLSGYNVVFGGAGYDTIYGGTGSDTIEAGSGGASVIGGIGSETYVYNRGDGNLDIAEDTTSAGSDLLELGSSLSESDISFTRQGNNLVMLVDGGAAGRIGITNYFAAPSGPAHAVTSIAFADGTSLDLAGVTAALVYNNAYITGATGSNLYRFDDYSGSNTIDQVSVTSSNTIQFTAGIDSSLIVARRDDNNNLVLTDSLDGVSVTVGGYFNNSLGAIDSNFSISFADGSTWNAQQILAATMTPSSGNDELWGSDGSDTITGGPGNDTIIGVSGNNVLTGGSGSNTIQGGSGADTITGGGGSNLLQGGTGAETYVFQLGNGSDTIVENGATPGTDTLQLGAGIQPSDVTFSHLGGSNDLLVRFGAATDSTVVVQGFLNSGGNGVHQLGSISFADGTSLTAAQVQAIAANVYASDNGIDTIQGGPGNNTIYGGSGSDTLIGGSGTNLIIGGSGTELIEGGSGYNTLIGGAGSDTIIAGPNGDLIDTGTGRALVETGAGNDTVDTTGGVDTLQPSNGNDTYQFGVGSGQDTLQDYAYYPKTGADTLLIGAGLTANDLTFTRVGTPGSSNDALVVGVKGTKDSFTIEGYFSYQDLAKNSSPLSLQFQDGSSLSFGQVQTLANAQSDWNGAVSSLDPAPNSAQPANVLQGREFARGDGAMVLDPGLNISADNVANGFGSNFYLAPGIRPQDVSLTADGDSVLLSIKGTSDSLYIPGLLDAGVDGYALTDINFYDGTVWDLPAVLQHISYGTGSLSAAGQVINATTGAETLAAAGPNDTINAIAGDTVGFGYGDGQTVLNMAPDNSGGNSGLSTVVLGAGILPSDVGISLSDFGISLTLKDTGESLAVDGESWDAWYPSIGQVQFANGTVWDGNNIQAMIDIGQPVELTDNSESPQLSAIIQALPVGTSVLFGGVNGATLDLGPSNALVVIDDGYGYQNDNASTTLNYGIDDGNVTIDDIHANQGYSFGNVSGPNTIQFGSGLIASDIAVSGTVDHSQHLDSYDSTFASDGEGTGNLLLTIKSTGKTITIPYFLNLDASGQLAVASSISNIAFQDGETIDLAALILGGDANITAMPGVVVGTRGATTLSGTAGDTIDAAIGNTVVLGSNQVITADASSQGSSTPPAESTYIFNTSTNGDTLSANVASTLEFAPGIDVSDVRAVNSDYGTTVYLRNTGAYVFLPNNGLTTTFSFGDGQSFTPQENGTTFTGAFGAAFSPTTPFVTSDASGDLGYYAAGVNVNYTQAAFVRGHVTNAVFGGSTWNAFDASATDISQLPLSMQAGIDSSLLSQPVTFTFAPGATGLFSNQEVIANYDANELIVDLSAGVTAQNLMVSESLGDIILSVAEPDGTVSRLTIDGFYSQVDGALQEKPLTIQFADGSSWNDQDIKQAIWQRSGGNTDTSPDMWIVSPSAQPIDLTKSGNGTYYQYVEIKNDGPNVLQLGQDQVNAAQGSDTFIIATNSNSQIKNFDPSQDIIQFAAGIDPSDIEVAQGYGFANAGANTYSYMFKLRSTGATLLTVSGSGLNPNDSADDFVQFANEVTWSSGDMVGTQTVAPNSGLVISQAIRGTVGDESLSGDIGDDVIAAGVGNDTLNGGGGHDTLYGGVGNDTFVFGPGSGYDTIVASNDGVHVNTLVVTSDVTPANVSVVRPNSGNDLELILNDTGETVLLPNYLASNAAQAVQAVTFADGTSWTVADLESMAHQGSQFSAYLAANAADESIAGGAGNDTIVGDENADTLAAGSGNDLIQSGNGDNTIIGGAGLDTIAGGWGSDLIVAGTGDTSILGGLGDETYRFGAAFGHDTLVADVSSDGIGSNVIGFEAGINASAVSFSLTGDGGLLISLDSNGDSILLPDHYVNGVPVADVDQIVFGDGSIVSMNQINQLLVASGGTSIHYVGGTVITGGDGNVEILSDNGNDVLVAGAGKDTLVGGSGTDVLQAGTGNDQLIGGSGSETYLFGMGFGHDSLTMNAAGVSNMIQFSARIRAADVRYRVSGNDLVISVASSTAANGNPSTLTLTNYFTNGVPSTALNQVVFDDGTVVPMAQVNQALTSSSGLDGTVVRVLPGRGVVITAPAGDDTLTADTGNDTLMGGSGNETLVGGSGNDTYMFGPGFGQDRVIVNAASISNTIAFAAGITAADVSFKASGNSLVIGVAGSIGADGQPSTLTLTNYFSAGVPVGKIGQVVYSDGTTVAMTQVNQALTGSSSLNGTAVKILPGGGVVITAPGGAITLTGDDGSDTLIGGSGPDTLQAGSGSDDLQAGAGRETLIGGTGIDLFEAGTGNDLLVAGSGVETYLFATGFGHDTLASASDATSNTIQFAAGIRAADVRYRVSGNDLVISVASSTAANGNPSTLTLSNYFTNGVPSTSVSRVVFNDGTVVPMTQVNQALTSSSSLDGTVVRVMPGSGVAITAPAGDDTLTADTGNDTLIGGSGNDTYMFGPGFGQDRVIVNAASISNTIAFAAGITAADVSFK
ncbi:calcium-binding protein, partial [Rhodanobacter ginsengisoli]